MKKIYFILIILLAYGCRSTKTSVLETTVETIVKDSIVYRDKIVVREGIMDTLYIENPCDSITGKLKPVRNRVKTPAGSVELKSSGMHLILTTSLHTSTDSIRFESINNVRLKDSALKEVQVTKTIVWSKWTYIFLLIAILELIVIIYLVKSKALNILTFIKNIFK